MMEFRSVLLLICIAVHAALSQEFKLFVTDAQGKIYVLDRNGTVVKTILHDKRIVGVAVDPFESEHGGISIIFSTLQNKTGEIIKHTLENDARKVIKDFQIEGQAVHAPRFVVDKTSGNIFLIRFLDGLPGLNAISVQTPSGREIGILPDLQAPTAIAIHTGRGLLFWSEIGNSPYIGSAGMDGSNTDRLVDSGLAKPIALAVDGELLYWIDTGLQRVERCDLIGGNRQIIFNIPTSAVSDIVIDGEYIYYSLTSTNQISKVKITDTSDLSTFATIPSAILFEGMAVYSASFPQQTTSNECSSRDGLGDCSDVCLPFPDGHACSCTPGSKLLGDAKTCSNAVQCPNLISNGQLPSDCNRFQIETCEVICDEGFQEEKVNITCNRLGNWNNETPCKSAILGAACSADGTVCVSTYSKCDNQTLTCRCIDGFTDADGNPNNIGGYCEKPCESFPRPTNGYLSSYSTLIENGAVIIVYCKGKYSLLGNSKFKCLPGGVWDITTMPECIQDCEIPEAIMFGFVHYTGLSHGSKASYYCNLGYNLTGKSIRSCTRGVWNESAPTCEPIDCRKTDIPHGSIVGGTKFNETPIINCDAGYYNISGSVLCREFGAWYIEREACHQERCYVPELNPVLLSSVTSQSLWSDSVNIGRVIEYDCEYGFELDGPYERTCEENSRLSGSQPTCVKKDCPTIQLPENARISSTNTSVDAHVTISCSDGLMYFGDPTLKCRLGGTWTGTVGTCVDTCPRGTFGREVDGTTMCIKCPRGYYQPQINQTDCLKCEYGLTTMHEGTVQKQCVSNCPNGYGIVFGVNTTCKPCPKGRFNDKTGQNPNSCKKCPSGLTTSAEGATSCTIQGAVTEPFLIKVSINLLYEAATNCSGTELSSIGKSIEIWVENMLTKYTEQYYALCATGNTTCALNITVQNCANSDTPDAPRTLNVNVMLQNVPNVVVDISDPGNQLPSEDVLGEIFTFYGEALTTSEEDSIQAELKGLGEDLKVIRLCKPGYIIADNESNLCESCAPGTYWKDQSACLLCQKDSYQNEFGQTLCKQCPDNTFSDLEGAQDASVCRSWCHNNGHYCNGHGVCTETGRRTANCSCDKGYKGDQCDQDINECLTNNHGCQKQCENFVGGYSCTCLDGFIKDLTDPTKCRVDFFPFGPQEKNLSSVKGDNVCSERITLPFNISIHGSSHKDLYACTNGILSFDWPQLNYMWNQDVTSIDRTILAPYYSALRYSNGPGTLYYKLYETDNLLSERFYVYLNNIMVDNSTDFNATVIFVATWFQAKLNSRKNENATFQLVLASNYRDTYVMYIYGDHMMNLRNYYTYRKPQIMIGYTVKGQVVKHIEYMSFTEMALDIDQHAETRGIKGVLMYHLTPSVNTTGDNGETLCLEWFDDSKKEKRTWEVFTACPCNKDMMLWDPWFKGIFGPGLDETDQRYEDIECFDSQESSRNSPNAVRCCFEKGSGGWVSDPKKGGGLLYYHPQKYKAYYQKFDANMKQYCCFESEHCDKYRELRPVGKCYNIIPRKIADIFGDPHFTTLDGKSYTFNGWGEYVVLQINSDKLVFQLHCRTDRATTDDGTITDATIFRAFSARDFSNASLYVELSSDKKGMNIFGNGVDLTLPFRNQSAGFYFRNLNLVMTRQNGSLNAFFVATEINLKISIGIGMLTQELSVPTSYNGLTEGLLGNFDGDSENDFVFRNGSRINGNSTDRAIFWFGQSWMTTEDESAFTYKNGQSHSNFSHPNFIPIFLDEFDPELVQNATKICGEESMECIFDKVVTGNDQIAADSQFVAAQYVDTIKVTNNMIPSVNGTRRLEIDLGATINTAVYAYDESDVTFSLSKGFDATLRNVTNRSAVIELRATTFSGEALSISATDILGMTSAPFVYDIVICTGCSGHGMCNFQEYKAGINSSDQVKYAKCICNGDSFPYWSGDDCEIDFDACSYAPCSWGRECEDARAAVHMLTGTAFYCMLCPDGYDLTADECVDKNECSENNAGCEQACINTEGSFFCSCNTGYRLALQNQSACEDINECDEALHSCQHICINRPGHYNCTCYDGYNLRNDNVSCEKVADVCSTANVDCSATAGCRLENGEAQCFCNTGYQLSESGNECINKNECLENVCSQTCTDTEGSYKCSCLVGYSLQSDGTSCAECDDTHWGINCANNCTCGRGTIGCDRTTGCQCSQGWTGLRCDTDIDECLQDAGVCGDVNMICSNTIGSFICRCRGGLQLGKNNTCQDINECDDLALNECEQSCRNVIGSFTCGCNTGYVSDPSDPLKCIDLDECSKGLADCEQICVNVPGRFNCDCYLGYKLNYDRKTCEAVSDEDLCVVFGGMNCSHFCIVENMQFSCSCPRGYTIGADNQTCTDIKECADPNLNLCSEPDTCVDYEGGYSCSCSIGFQLENDGRTCLPCDAFHYGLNCEETCDCEKGADRCDRVTGCICQPGWFGGHCELDRDECSSLLAPCIGDGQTCLNTPGSYDCACDTGFQLEDNKCVDIDECFTTTLNTCDQICINTEGSFSCQCDIGFIFEDGHCKDIDECQGPNDCQHICTNTLGGYRCQCNSGYKLDLTDRRSCIAEVECNTLNVAVCSRLNADCVLLHGQPECQCRKGYEKNSSGHCSDIKECELQEIPCSQVCVEEDGGYSCMCNIGFKLQSDGKTCLPCQQGTYGTDCSHMCLCNVRNTISCNATTGACSCKKGYKGLYCNEDVNECSEKELFVCPENSDCINNVGSYICKCRTGYYKTSSGICLECENGRWGTDCLETCTCTAIHTKRCDPVCGQCVCQEGWSGTKCDRDVNECLTEANICDSDKETCENTLGSFQCLCKDGYVQHADGCLDKDECTDGTALCSQYCINTNGSYECRCSSGYKLYGTSCIACEPDRWGIECQNVCSCIPHHTKTCNASTGQCECQDGWSDTFCETDVNECDREGVCGLDKELCENTNGSYRCFCIEGFGRQESGDCSDIDECLTGQANCSQDCFNTLGSYECHCYKGYKMEQEQCIDIDECTENTSLCSHECINTDGSYECRCPAGLKLLGFTCTECTTGTWGEGCRNNCTCVPENTISCRADTGDCDCWGGWTGSSCESDINECMNDNICDVTTEVCENKNGSYRCACKEGFGRHEDLGCTDIDECFLGLVECAQVCVNTIGSYHCRCQPGYRSEGNNCTDINECDEGTARCPQECINTEGSYNCNCSSGYANTNFSCEECDPGKWGPECQEDCECVPEHTEQCNSKTGGCQCRQGWTGLTCEDDINECATANACDSITEDCTNNEGSYTCICKPGLGKYGSECIDIDECQVGLANCSQECINTHGSYQCKCRPGFAIWDSSCKECDEGRWGDECQGECTCVLENTESCNATTGHCHCNSDWFGDTCTDECLTDNDCNATTEYCANEMGSQICACKNNFGRVNGVCQINCLVGTYTDTADGSPVCRPCPKGKYQNASNQDSCLKCDPGYTTQETGNIAKENCSECEPGQWGDNCLTDCLCVSDNTELCSHVDGNCQCKVGWNGSRCELDVNECLSDNTCEPKTEICENINGSYKCNCKEGLGRFNDVCRDIDECLEGLAGCSQECINTPGSYYCKCRPGFTTNGSECTDCDEGKWGDECQEDCSCDPDNSELCDSSGGHCECKDGWTGQLCETDVNECSIENNCDPLKEDCENTNGSYQCKCKQGYRRVVDICEVDCPKGTYINNTNPSVVCLACPQGEYQELVNQDSCVICDQDYTTVSTGSIMKEQCVPDCPPGEGITYGASKDCQPCDVGKYNDKSGANPNLCKECPLGFTTESAGQQSCTVPVTVTPAYQTRVTLPLVYEVETDCSAESLRNIIDSLLSVIKLLLMKFDDLYRGLCGVDMKSCDEIDVTVGDCSSLKRAPTHSIALNVTISGVPNYVQDDNDDSRLPVETVLAEIFESNPTDVSSEENAIQYVGLGAEPRSIAICETGTEMIDGVCRCTNNTYGDNCLFICECDVVNTISPTQSCDSVTGVCLCLSTWGGQKCTWDIDECTSNLHDCDITDNRVCQNKINGFDCVCSEGYTETADQKCSKDIQKDDYGMIIGLSVGIPLGIVAVVAMGLSVYLCRRNSTTKRTYRNWNRRYTREERERTHAREEYVSTVHRHYPTPTPEGTAAYKSVSTWYSGSGSGEYRPYQDIDRQSSRNWIERSLALERGLTITRPKVDREESI